MNEPWMETDAVSKLNTMPVEVQEIMAKGRSLEDIVTFEGLSDITRALFQPYRDRDGDLRDRRKAIYSAIVDNIPDEQRADRIRSFITHCIATDEQFIAINQVIAEKNIQLAPFERVLALSKNRNSPVLSWRAVDLMNFYETQPGFKFSIGIKGELAANIAANPNSYMSDKDIQAAKSQINPASRHVEIRDPQVMAIEMALRRDERTVYGNFASNPTAHEMHSRILDDPGFGSRFSPQPRAEIYEEFAGNEGAISVHKKVFDAVENDEGLTNNDKAAIYAKFAANPKAADVHRLVFEAFFNRQNKEESENTNLAFDVKEKFTSEQRSTILRAFFSNPEIDQQILESAIEFVVTERSFTEIDKNALQEIATMNVTAEGFYQNLIHWIDHPESRGNAFKDLYQAVIDDELSRFSKFDMETQTTFRIDVNFTIAEQAKLLDVASRHPKVKADAGLSRRINTRARELLLIPDRVPADELQFPLLGQKQIEISSYQRREADQTLVDSKIPLFSESRESLSLTTSLFKRYDKNSPMDDGGGLGVAGVDPVLEALMKRTDITRESLLFLNERYADNNNPMNAICPSRQAILFAAFSNHPETTEDEHAHIKGVLPQLLAQAVNNYANFDYVGVMEVGDTVVAICENRDATPDVIQQSLGIAMNGLPKPPGIDKISELFGKTTAAFAVVNNKSADSQNLQTAFQIIKSSGDNEKQAKFLAEYSRNFPNDLSIDVDKELNVILDEVDSKNVPGPDVPPWFLMESATAKKGEERAKILTEVAKNEKASVNTLARVVKMNDEDLSPTPAQRAQPLITIFNHPKAGDTYLLKQVAKSINGLDSEHLRIEAMTASIPLLHSFVEHGDVNKATMWMQEISESSIPVENKQQLLVAKNDAGFPVPIAALNSGHIDIAEAWASIAVTQLVRTDAQHSAIEGMLRAFDIYSQSPAVLLAKEPANELEKLSKAKIAATVTVCLSFFGEKTTIDNDKAQGKPNAIERFVQKEITKAIKAAAKQTGITSGKAQAPLTTTKTLLKGKATVGPSALITSQSDLHDKASESVPGEMPIEQVAERLGLPLGSFKIRPRKEQLEKDKQSRGSTDSFTAMPVRDPNGSMDVEGTAYLRLSYSNGDARKDTDFGPEILIPVLHKDVPNLKADNQGVRVDATRIKPGPVPKQSKPPAAQGKKLKTQEQKKSGGKKL